MGVPERVPLTLEDYWKFPNDGKRYEIVGGELEVSPSPVTEHQRLVTLLAHLLMSFIDEVHSGLVLAAPMDVILSQHDVCQPDVLFIRSERVPEIVKDRIHGAPDLVIEVLSPSTSSWDHVKKRLSYEKFGVREYWIVDPIERNLFRYIHDGTGFGRPELFEEGASVTSSLLPGFTLELSRLFAGRVA